MSVLDEALASLFGVSLGVRPEEGRIIVADDGTAATAADLYQGARRLGLVPPLLRRRPPCHPSQEPSGVVGVATAAGVRPASWAGVTLDRPERSLAIDCETWHRETVAQSLTGSEARLTSPAGTALRLEPTGQPVLVDGNLKQPGAFGNLPADEVFLVDRSAEGVAVLDGALAGSGEVLRPLPPVSAVLAKSHRDSLRSLGVGLNPRPRLTGQVLADEKILGTVHPAPGESCGGADHLPPHPDGIIQKPTWTVDGGVLPEGNLQWR